MTYHLTETVDFVMNVHVQLGFDISRSEVVLWVNNKFMYLRVIADKGMEKVICECYLTLLLILFDNF
jgi:hypothetical protein